MMSFGRWCDLFEALEIDMHLTRKETRVRRKREAQKERGEESQRERETETERETASERETGIGSLESI